jgi:hypothetical protein
MAIVVDLDIVLLKLKQTVANTRYQLQDQFELQSKNFSYDNAELL